MIRSALVGAMLILCISCAQEQFSVDSLSLSGVREVSIENGAVSEREHLILSARFSADDSSYGYSITSPDGDLVWEGEMSGQGIKRSENIEITPGASFMAGEYSVILYSDNGTEYSTTVSYRHEDDYPYFDSSGALSQTADVDEYDEQGNLAATGTRDRGYIRDDSSARAVMRAGDRYGNTVITEQMLSLSGQQDS